MSKVKLPLLADAAILYLWDMHVSEPNAKYPLADADKIAFANAVLATQKPLVIYDTVSGAVTLVGRPAGEWMPIETAPEGTMILCANMNAEEAREWAYVAWISQGKVCCMFRCGMPTHWMPLPAPPKENNHAEGADQEPT